MKIGIERESVADAMSRHRMEISEAYQDYAYRAHMVRVAKCYYPDLGSAMDVVLRDKSFHNYVELSQANPNLKQSLVIGSFKIPLPPKYMY